MKKFLSLLAVLMAAVYVDAQPGSPLKNIGEQTFTYDFENNPLDWPVGEGANFADGNITEPLAVGELSLSNEQGEATQPARLMRANDGVSALYVYKNGAVKLANTSGRAITKIAVTMKSGTFDLTPSNGTVTENVWQGNATEVKFTASGTRQILNMTVITNKKDGETIEPKAEVFDVEAANIAAFNATEDGKAVKLTLTDARVNGTFNGYYVEDATGATVVKGLTLTPGTKLNGYIIGTKNTDSTIDYVNTPAVAVEYQLIAAETDEPTYAEEAVTLAGTAMTISEACAQASYAKLVTLSNVAISGTGQNKTLTDAQGNTMKARDYMAVLPADYVWPEQAASITGVVMYYMTGWFIMPISAEAIVEAGAQTSVATFDFASPTIRDNIGTTLTDPAGYIYNETFAADGATLQITSGSAPSRIYVDGNRGQNLTTYKEYTTLTFRAPEGKAITKIEFAAAGNSNINNFSASAGTIEDMTWTGNADGVRFLQGGTSYLANAVVTLADKDDETTALPAIEYTVCANIAAFNALEAGTYAKVTLTDAEITGISADGYSTVFMQDATGGCWMQYTTMNKLMAENTKLNGFIYVVKRYASGNPQMKEAEDTPDSKFNFDTIEQPTMVEGTIADVNVPENLNRVVKITKASFLANSATKGTLTQDETTIAMNNGTATANQQLHKIEPWVANETKMEKCTVVAILVANSATENLLLPISITDDTSTGIADVQRSTADSLQVYSMQGVRLNRLQRGVNIVNGKKIVVK